MKLGNKQAIVWQAIQDAGAAGITNAELRALCDSTQRGVKNMGRALREKGLDVCCFIRGSHPQLYFASAELLSAYEAQWKAGAADRRRERQRAQWQRKNERRKAERLARGAKPRKPRVIPPAKVIEARQDRSYLSARWRTGIELAQAWGIGRTAA